MDLCSLPLLELSGLLRRGEVSAREATGACLARIGAVDGRVRAFLRVDEEGALAAAEASDARRRAGQGRGVLEGVPLALKDNLLTRGLTTTCASRMLAGFVPPYDATVVERLREAGAVLVGKLNLDEFAMGSSTESSAFHPTHNPYDLGRTPGGSSGGSAAAVAAREVWGALGSDTGGSLRQPAAFTNTVGLRPTWGRVSRYGLVAHASSLDQVGPLARTVADAAALLQAIAGHDARDATSLAEQVPDFTPLHPGGLAGLRLGLPREWLEAGLDAEVEAVLQEAVRVYRRLGAQVEEVHLPHTPQALAAYYVLAPAEASSNLARFDGVRYGLRAPGADTLERLYGESRALGFGPEVKRRILLGTHALCAGSRAALYQRAQAVRARVRAELEEVLTRVDVLLSPTCPVPAFPLGAVQEGWDMYRMDALTVPCSLAGLPGLSLPGGFTRGGLPVGLQLVARPLEEALLLQVAQAFERECPHHLRAPAP